MADVARRLAAGVLLAAGMLAGTTVRGGLASGGTVTNYTANGTNWVAHIFSTVGPTSIVFDAAGNVEYLVVAGGGGGGTRHGGGGGAGGLLAGTTNVTAQSYTIIVGGGGAGGPGKPAPEASRYGGAGTNSSFGTIAATGGGGGRTYSSELGHTGNGGSGGGGAGMNSQTGGSATSGQGNAGGNGRISEAPGGGGGGAGTAGKNAPTSINGGDGGTGVVSSISGVATYYAGGGGGGGDVGGTGGTGGPGGGGHGGDNGVQTSQTPGTDGTGGGGGGCRGNTESFGGSPGGSGIVIVRYPVLSVLLSAPTPSQAFIYPVSITATATVSAGTAPHTVTFYTNVNDGDFGEAVNVGLLSGTTYTNALGTLDVGNYKIYAKVVDSASTTNYSATNAFSVALPALTVTLNAPANNTTVPFDVSIAATATVAYAEGSTNVQFYTNSTLSGTYGLASAGSLVSGETYANAATIGTMESGTTNYIYAMVTDQDSTAYSVTNAIITLAPPSVSLTAPTDNGEFYAGTAIAASATVAGGAPTYTVTFYTNQGAEAYVQAGNPDSTPPYGVSLTGLAVGDNYHVYAKVSDGYYDEATSSTRTFKVLPTPTEILVAANSADPKEPYATWGTAAHDIKTALDYAASLNVDIVTVSNGTYNITSEIVVSNAITVRSFKDGVYGGLSGAASTIVSGNGSCRVFNIKNSAAKVDGFAICNGRGESAVGDDAGIGGGVRLSGGFLSNCMVTNNQARAGNVSGGGIYIGAGGGTVSNCLIKGNRADEANQNNGGGGIYVNYDNVAAPVTIMDCKILNNACSKQGGGVFVYNGGDHKPTAVIRNCLIAGNRQSSTDADERYDGGGGLYHSGRIRVILESSTIASNTAIYGGGICFRNLGEPEFTMTNSIVYGNMATTRGVNHDKNLGATTWRNSCTTPAIDGWDTASMTSSDPLFVNAAAGDFSLQQTSPCIDTGVNKGWMTGAKDLAGNDRILKGSSSLTVDMGAFETYVPPSGTLILLR